MKEISIFDWLTKLNTNEPREYSFSDEICHFPLTNEYINLKDISEGLRNKGIFLKHEESFEKRKYTCEEDEEWKAFFANLRRKRGNICELSRLNFSKTQYLSKKIFGLDKKYVWINNWLTPHHISDDVEYRCFDENKLMILNRAIHMVYHDRKFLKQFITSKVPNYELYFEIGSLVRKRNGKYPWRDIQKKGENDGSKNNCYQW